MNANIKKRLEQIEASFGPPSILGIWAHDNGRPTFHQLAGFDMSIERWFKTGELPRDIEFVGVICTPESDRLWTPGPERRQPHEFTPTPEQLHESWEPFPDDLHPGAVKQLEKMIEQSFYSFINGQLRGMNGPLPPHEQRRELYPHG